MLAALKRPGTPALRLEAHRQTPARAQERAAPANPSASWTYTLSFDYAGHLGYDANHTRIGVYLDGTRVGTYANTSPNTSLNRQTVSFSFTGNGNLQDLRIVMEGNVSGNRGAMIDDVVLVEDLPLNTGYMVGNIRFQQNCDRPI